MSMTCPLCGSDSIHAFSRDDRRDYYRCPVCRMVFVPPSQFLSPDDEKKRYDLHRNPPDDRGYRAYLNRLFFPLKQHLSPCSHGLDFGSGPEPALSAMLEESGHSMSLFDRYYAPDAAVLEGRYDFITASEVLEHLQDPRNELERLWSCLKQDGILGIMTQFAVSREVFPGWYYKNDPTHVCFFSQETFEWLADLWGAEARFPEKGVVLLRKKQS